MPDVTMCISKSCNKEGCCYRAMKKPDKYQSFEDFTKNLCR